MLTTLSISSLDQGSELARRQVARLHAEPREATIEPEVIDSLGSASATMETTGRPKWRALFAGLISRWATRYSPEALRY